MTETIDVSVLRDTFAGLDKAFANFGTNTFSFLRSVIGFHPEPEVKDWLLEQLDYLEQQIFPERWQDDTQEN